MTKQNNKTNNTSEQLVSICVACYNVAPYIRRCLESICAQSYRNLEILCMDDASTDKTASIIASLQKKDSRIHLVRNRENKNLVFSRKRILEYATGDYVICVDGDDSLEKHAVKTAMAYVMAYDYPDIVEYKANVIFTNPEHPAKAGLVTVGKKIKERITKTNYCKLHLGVLEQPDILQELVRDNLGQMLWNKIIRRELLVKAYTYCDKEDLYYKDDVYACCFLYALAKSYVGIDQTLYNYYFDTGKSKHMKSKKDFLEMCKLGDVVQSLIRYYKQDCPPELRAIYRSLIVEKSGKWFDLLTCTLRDNSTLDRQWGQEQIQKSFSFMKEL